MNELSTSDLGLAIRDHIEEKLCHRFDPASGQESDDCAEIEHVDVSDASNPVVHVNGQIFILNIVRVPR